MVVPSSESCNFLESGLWSRTNRKYRSYVSEVYFEFLDFRLSFDALGYSELPFPNCVSFCFHGGNKLRSLILLGYARLH